MNRLEQLISKSSFASEVDKAEAMQLASQLVLLGYISKDRAVTTKAVGRDLPMYSKPSAAYCIPVYAVKESE